jgi:hypothetical protein
MKPFKSIPISCALTAVSFAAGAYESDLHYGLTYFLASQVGLNAQQSHELARGDELMDTGVLDAKQAIGYELCIKGNVKASLWTRHFHFRAKKVPPALPKDRPVSNQDIFAEGQTNSVIKAVHDAPDAKVDYLFKLGQALHGWQDSYSHEGVSNTFWKCPTEYIWSHSGKEGVFSHKVDQTFEDVDKCASAGKSTYEYLLKYRESMKFPRIENKWAELEPKVRVFCSASTKVEKARWLRQNGVPQSNEIAKNTSLKSGGRTFFWDDNINLGEQLPAKSSEETDKEKPATKVAAYELQMPGFLPNTDGEEFEDLGNFKTLLSNPRATASPQAEALSRGFLQALLTSPPDKLAEAMEPYFGKSIQLQESANIKNLRRLRLKDRESQNAADTNVTSQRVRVGDYVTYTADDWPSALVPVRGKNSPALVAEEGGRIFVIAIFRNAPNDLLMIEATSDFEIKDISTLVYH